MRSLCRGFASLRRGAFTEPNCVGRKKEGRGKIIPRPSTILRLRLTASPSAASVQPHLLVTTTHWDHLLPLVPPWPPPGTISRAVRLLAPRATVARTDAK